MAKSLHARLVAYRPFGNRLGVLAEPVSFSASMLHDDDGAISIEYSMLSGDAQAFDRELTDGLEVAVEVSDGNGYREPDNARFVITGRSGKTDDRTRTVTYSGQSISWLLSKAENNDSSHLLADGDNKGKRPFYSANPGVILKTLLDENKARGGVATGLTLGFDTAKDAGGAAWAKKYTLYYSLGTDLQTILSSLVNGGGCDWRTSGRTLKLWNADSAALSRDLSKQVILQLVRDIGEAPYEESISDLASTILVEGDNNLLFRMDNPSAPTPWGKWESYSSQGGVSDKDTAQAFMQSTLDDAARVRGQYTRDLVISEVDSLPLVDYHAGDWITAPTVSHGEKVRVQEIDLSMRQGEGLSCSIALNDIKYDASVRQAKKLKGITGGAALAGSEGGTTASSDRDHRVPKAPLGLVVQTDAYIGSDGFAHGLATASWSAVTQATNNTAIDISGYRVEYRKNLAGAPWVSGGVTDAQRLTLGIGGLECGQRYEFRVRAVPTYSDKLGDWSNVVVALVASDVTPPSIPSKPILTSKLGVVDVQWDGRNNAGGGMELDFDHVEVGISDSNGNWKYRDSVARDGHCVVTGLEYRVYWFALRSVDHSGNKSDWGVGASITVASAVSQADLDRLDKDLRDNKTAIDNANRELSQAKQDIAGNTTAIGNANRELATAKSDLTQAKKDITQAKSDAANAKNEAGKANAAIESAKSDIANAASKAQSALDKANSVGKSLDGLHNVYEGPDDPTTLSGVTVRQGDFWYKTQKYWTRWSGAANDSTSLLADFYTGWEGEPNNSASWLVPLSSRFIGVYVFDGSRWNERNIVAANILASGSVVASNMAANSITTKKLVAGAITTDKVAANAIVAGKIAAGAITTEKLAALAVTAEKLAANSVVAGKLAANSVNAGNIVSGAITTEKLAALSVTVDKLAANSVNASKIVSQSITGDEIASNTIVARNIAAQSITSDKVAAGQFVGYVFTGSIFQSSTADNTGWKLKGNALDMWDSKRNHTVHLDGEGANNLLTGTFQTGLSGNRVMISPSFQQSEVTGSDKLEGAGIQFYHGTGSYKHPYIAVESTTQQEGEVSALTFNGGRRAEHDPGAFARIGERKGSDNTTKGGTVFLAAYQDYDSPDTGKKRAYLTLWSPKTGDTTATLAAQDPNGRVGIQADIDSGYLYMGGFLGSYASRGTFQSMYWDGTHHISPWMVFRFKGSWTPPRYGSYKIVGGVNNATGDALCTSAPCNESSSGAEIMVQSMPANVGGYSMFPGGGTNIWCTMFGYLRK